LPRDALEQGSRGAEEQGKSEGKRERKRERKRAGPTG